MKETRPWSDSLCDLLLVVFWGLRGCAGPVWNCGI